MTAETTSKEHKSNEETANNTAVSQEQTQERIPESLDEILQSMDPEQIALLDRVVPGLIPYMRIQEAKINYIGENALSKQWLEEQKKNMVQAAAAPLQVTAAQPSQTGVVPNLLQLLAMVGGGGSSSDSEFAELGKDLLKVQIENLKHESDFTRSIKNAIVSKITGKAIGDVI